MKCQRQRSSGQRCWWLKAPRNCFHLIAIHITWPIRKQVGVLAKGTYYISSSWCWSQLHNLVTSFMGKCIVPILPLCVSSALWQPQFYHWRSLTRSLDTWMQRMIGQLCMHAVSQVSQLCNLVAASSFGQSIWKQVISITPYSELYLRVPQTPLSGISARLISAVVPPP